MRHYYTADAIRAAEAPLLQSLPDGVLMRRAAYGLSVAVARKLSADTGGCSGRGVCAIVGSGDNGGDALWAAAFLPSEPGRCIIHLLPLSENAEIERLKSE